MVEAEVGELLVARLWRWDAARLHDDALLDRRKRLAEGEVDPDHSISVFATHVRENESTLEAARRLCAHILTVPRSARWVTFTTERNLQSKGFVLRRSGPFEKHYDIPLGDDIDEADVDGLAAVFREHTRRRFPTCDL